MQAILADTFSNALLNISTQLSEKKLACVAVFSVSSQREKPRAKGKSRERMGREQKEERGGGAGSFSFPSLPLPPATNFFVTSVPEPSRDSRLPERKRKRLLHRLEKHPRDVHNQNNKDLDEQFTILKKCRGKFECLVYEMLYIQEMKPKLNTQSDSIKAKLFHTY